MSNKIKLSNSKFLENIGILGFDVESDSIFFLDSDSDDPQIRFHIEVAKKFDATAVFLRKQLGSYKPQAYIYDFTGSKDINEQELANIQRKIWSSGEAPIACVFYDTEIKIINCAVPIKENDTPVYLIKHLNVAAKANSLYNKQFAVKIKSGVFWEEEDVKGKFSFAKSSYDFLIYNIKKIKNDFSKQHQDIDTTIINKLIIQSILIKYLEERVDEKGNNLFTLSEKYFKKYKEATKFTDVLRNEGSFSDLLNDLDADFNGNVFYWQDHEKKVIKSLSLEYLANALDADYNLHDGQRSFWRYYEFNYIPVELISRLYEEFLGVNKASDGLYYTPSHLAKLLVDESMPLHEFKKIDLENYKILDPACGSGIFLVVAYKRLIQWWRLQNNFERPTLTKLKKILIKSIFGVDKNPEAVRLSTFSLCLALCDELSSKKQLIEKLRFEDLAEQNIIDSDFFTCDKFEKTSFDLIIGNPPFSRGAINEYGNVGYFGSKDVSIPQGQIALKFLSDSMPYLKEKGLQCLIIKSSGLLYNSTSEEYKELLFSTFNVIQVLDFTALARNKTLWDNGADVASAAIFTRKESPDFRKNILHVTFRRTKATKERIVFEIDEYDLHYINRQVAIENNFIWKINLLGGGRIKGIIDCLQHTVTLDKYLKKNDCIVGEGYIIGTKGKLNPHFIYGIKTMPTEAFTENGIDYSSLKPMNDNVLFVKVPKEEIFKAPNILIKENIGTDKMPVYYNRNKSFSFKDKIIGIASLKADKVLLEEIVNSFDKFSDFYRFYIYVTSSQILINLNTAILKADIMRLPFVGKDGREFSDFDSNIINDVNTYMQDFTRHGENSYAVKPIKENQFLINYGNEFSRAINLIYGKGQKKYRLSDLVTLCEGAFIAAVFRYDSKKSDLEFHLDNSTIDIQGMSDQEISKHLTINRIIRYYPEKDVVVFIKPNQYRYWLSLIAYRDADKYFAELSKRGI